MFGFLARWVARETLSLTEGREALGATGKHFVGVGLMTGIPENDVLGRVEYAVDGEGEFDHAEV